MLPGMDGLEVCRRIQQDFDVYILMLTARAEEIDKIVGLSSRRRRLPDQAVQPARAGDARQSDPPAQPRARPATAAQRIPERPALHFDELQIDPDTREVWHDSARSS